MSKIITIGRELGSGGRTIGKQVASRLGIPYYDRELVDEAVGPRRPFLWNEPGRCKKKNRPFRQRPGASLQCIYGKDVGRQAQL